jgi:hypothetical protein
MTSQEKPGRETDRSTSVQWVQEASAFKDLGAVSYFGWAEKIRGSELAAIARTLKQPRWSVTCSICATARPLSTRFRDG